MDVSKNVYTLQRRQRRQIIDEINRLNKGLKQDPSNKHLQQKLEECWTSIHRLGKNRLDVAAKAFGYPATCA